MQKKRKPLVERLAIAEHTCELRPQRVQIEHRLIHIENEHFRLCPHTVILRLSGGVARGRKNARASATQLCKKIQWAGHHGGTERGCGEREISSAHECIHLSLPRVLVEPIYLVR